MEINQLLKYTLFISELAILHNYYLYFSLMFSFFFFFLKCVALDGFPKITSIENINWLQYGVDINMIQSQKSICFSIY